MIISEFNTCQYNEYIHNLMSKSIVECVNINENIGNNDDNDNHRYSYPFFRQQKRSVQTHHPLMMIKDVTSIGLYIELYKNEC
jgi:hypothetical protein